MKRKRMRRSKDRKIFSRTAAKTKDINVRPGEWRGGIRL